MTKPTLQLDDLTLARIGQDRSLRGTTVPASALRRARELGTSDQPDSVLNWPGIAAIWIGCTEPDSAASAPGPSHHCGGAVVVFITHNAAPPVEVPITAENFPPSELSVLQGMHLALAEYLD